MKKSNMPYSLNLSGGGLDQMYLNKFIPGWNLTLSIEPTYQFLERSGMATSTRNTAIKMWKNLPEGDEVELAEKLFKKENMGRKNIRYVSGFQDSAGVIIQGLTACWYDDDFYPEKIIRIQERETLDWLQENIELFEVGQRKEDFNLFKFSDLNYYAAKRLADYSRITLNAIETKNLKLLGECFNQTRRAYKSIFPESMPEHAQLIANELEKKCQGVKPNGAGGGGYFMCAGKVGGIPIKVR